MPISFYNPKKSAITLSISYEKKWGLIEIANSLNPNAGFKSAKGSRVFDWQNKLIFAISPEEAPILMKFIKGPKKEYETLTHAPSGNTKEKMSSLTISGKFPYISLSISITENNQKRKGTFTLRSGDKGDEISIFYKFLEKIVEAPFVEDYMRRLVKFSIDYRKELEAKQNVQNYQTNYNQY